MVRIFFDTNAGTHDDGYILWFDTSIRELKQIQIRDRDEVLVVLYMPDELEFIARLKYDDTIGYWRGVPLNVA